jgi:hypothetical protein
MPEYLSRETAMGMAMPIAGGRATVASCRPFEMPGLAKRSLVTEFSGVSDNLLTDALACTALLLQCTEPDPEENADYVLPTAQP